jgi:hypothetical protein
MSAPTPGPRSPTPSLVTLAAIGVVVYAISNVAHEGSHGLACVATGGTPVAFSSTYFECDRLVDDDAAAKFGSAAGTLANLVLAALSFAALRGSPAGATTRRYALWLAFTVNALQAGGYWLFSGAMGVGDWAKVARGPHDVSLRAAFFVVGLLAYVGAIRLSLRELAPLLGGDDGWRRARRLMLVPYLAGGALYVAAGLLNPIGVEIVLMSAVAASFGGTSALAWMYNLLRSPRRSPPGAAEPFAPPTSRPWAIAAAVAAAVFVGVLGPSIRFLPPHPDSHRFASPAATPAIAPAATSRGVCRDNTSRDHATAAAPASPAAIAHQPVGSSRQAA